MTYYTLENNTLKKCGTVEKIDGVYVTNPTAEQYAAIGAYPRSDESFAPPKCDEGYHAVADGYELVVRGQESGVSGELTTNPSVLTPKVWTRKWRIEEVPPPPPRTFSKMKVIVALMEMGIWLTARDYIVSANLYDLFLAAQDFKEDDKYFKEGLESLKAKLNLTDEQIEQVLAASVADR